MEKNGLRPSFEKTQPSCSTFGAFNLKGRDRFCSPSKKPYKNIRLMNARGSTKLTGLNLIK